uniref:Small ribosomal subunit protein bS1c n=1 Tax=Porphyra purpurea TaxID=2787 RepID=RR1_PORPU|nr:ribosomal protein S1 [Porphyra purpurea]P51345.1 RecName: Full=Small ribosomal subunit protein bS1c; AltName: Full=30S ribosomal protein S1, chloroplastic [Porphyra purpurea]AAC08231.1 30S ribosomal protein S1 [Porphyra purpurea]
MTKNNESFTHRNFAAVLQKYKYDLNLGDIVAGTIFSFELNGVLVDIGTPVSAYLPIQEVSSNQELNNFNSLNINDTREFFLLDYNVESRQLILSIRRLEYIRAWKRIRQLLAEDSLLDVRIKGFNKGGMIVNLEGISGFVPNSHLNNFSKNTSSTNKFIKLKLLNVEEKSNNLILSHRRALIAQASSNLIVGNIIEGVINQITPYGLFIKAGNLKGLVHISEINVKQVERIPSQFKIGDTIKAVIIHVDKKQGRLSLSMKHLK